MNKYCFIDSQNLYLGIKGQGWKLDYKKFYIYLKEKIKVDKVFMYIGYIKENEEMYNSFKEYGYELVFKNTKQYGKEGEQVKGNIDVDLTVDAIRKLNEYNHAVFISADGDFSSLYKYITIEKKKELTIMIPDRYKYSSFLLKYRKQLRFMNDLKNKLK